MLSTGFFCGGFVVVNGVSGGAVCPDSRAAEEYERDECNEGFHGNTLRFDGRKVTALQKGADRTVLD